MMTEWEEKMLDSIADLADAVRGVNDTMQTIHKWNVSSAATKINEHTLRQVEALTGGGVIQTASIPPHLRG